MLTIRAALWYLMIAINVIVWLMILIILALFGTRAALKVPPAWSRISAWLTIWICGIRYEVKGAENLKNMPVIFFSKHESAWETIVFLGILPQSCYVLKKSLLKIPFFGWGIRLTKQIAIDRSQGMQALKLVIQEGKKRLAMGISIILFPEGTRVAPGEHPRFHKSGAALAKATGYPIVPIAHNAGLCWRRNSFLKYPGKVTVIIGAPIATQDKTVDEINAAVYEWMKTTMQTIE